MTKANLGVVEVKTALTLQFAFIVTVAGLAAPLMSPAQRTAAAQQRMLANVAVQELEAQKRRLASYAKQAQFALASLYDGATAGVAQ